MIDTANSERRYETSTLQETHSGRGHLERTGREKKNSGQSKQALQDVRIRVHSKLVDMLDLASLANLEADELKAQLRPVIMQLLDEEAALLTGGERQQIVVEILDEIFGFGPLEPLLADESVSDILVNGSQEVFIERFGKLERTKVTFRDDDHLLQVIDRIVSRVGRRIDETSPMVDARLPDGSRVNAIIPPLSVDGPCMAIRRFGVNPLGAVQLLKNGSITEEILEFLKGAVKAGLNVLISGGTGSGKTTLLNILSSFIPHDERIISIEDSAELLLQQPHVVRLETRPPNIEGAGQVTQRDLLFNSLRMRPDRIIVGEVRGAEALDMLQAMNTGHDGSLTTIHANAPRDALSRIETMVSMTGLELPVSVVRHQMASAFDIVIQASRLFDGRRRVMSVSEVLGMEGDIITMQEVFAYKLHGVDEETGIAEGAFISTGLRPQCVNKIKSHGINLRDGIFERHQHELFSVSQISETGPASESQQIPEAAIVSRKSPENKNNNGKRRNLGGLSALRDRIRRGS